MAIQCIHLYTVLPPAHKSSLVSIQLAYQELYLILVYKAYLIPNGPQVTQTTGFPKTAAGWTAI